MQNLGVGDRRNCRRLDSRSSTTSRCLIEPRANSSTTKGWQPISSSLNRRTRRVSAALMPRFVSDGADRPDADRGNPGDGGQRRAAVIERVRPVEVGDAFFGNDVGDVVTVDHHRRQRHPRMRSDIDRVQRLDERGYAAGTECLRHLHHQLAAASVVRFSSGWAMARTSYPLPCNAETSPSQLDESAHAPCTSTTVGFGPGGAGWAVLMGVVGYAQAAEKTRAAVITAVR